MWRQHLSARAPCEPDLAPRCWDGGDTGLSPRGARPRGWLSSASLLLGPSRFLREAGVALAHRDFTVCPGSLGRPCLMSRPNDFKTSLFHPSQLPLVRTTVSQGLRSAVSTEAPISRGAHAVAASGPDLQGPTGSVRASPALSSMPHRLRPCLTAGLLVCIYGQRCPKKTFSRARIVKAATHWKPPPGAMLSQCETRLESRLS